MSWEEIDKKYEELDKKYASLIDVCNVYIYGSLIFLGLVLLLMFSSLCYIRFFNYKGVV